MDVHDHHGIYGIAYLARCFGVLLIGLAAVAFVLWMGLSEPKTKLYEADNMVCASQPFSSQCWERKPR